MATLTPTPLVRLARPVERLPELLARPVDDLADLVFESMLHAEAEAPAAATPTSR